MIIKVDDQIEYEAEFNGFTPIVFSRHFTVENANGTKRPKDISEAVGMIVESIETYEIPSITGLLEIFYACIVTADPKFKMSFYEWAATLPPTAYDMENGEGWATDVMAIVQQNFFPRTASGLAAATA